MLIDFYLLNVNYKKGKTGKPSKEYGSGNLKSCDRIGKNKPL